MGDKDEVCETKYKASDETRDRTRTQDKTR